MAQTKSKTKYTLDSLAEMDADSLDSIFRSGSVPSDLGVLNGRPKGRMLAVRYTDTTPFFGALKFVSSNNFFPWDGKTFIPVNSQNELIL